MQLNGNSIQKITFMVFFTLVVFALSTEILPIGYFLTQNIIIALYIWSFISIENTEPIYMVAYGTAISVVLDAVLIGISWNNAIITAHGKYGFSMAMAIICLIVKPFFVLININYARQKEGQSALGPSFGNWSNTPQQPNMSGANSSNAYGGGYQQQS